MLGNGDRRSPARGTTSRQWLLWTLYLLIVVGIEVSWRPQAFTQSQFWAEDGNVWFADAHNHGVAALFIPVAGYWQGFQRLVALALSPLGMLWAPLAFNVVGLVIETIPPLLIASSRMSGLIPDRRVRVALGIAYAAIPFRELHFSVTNSQWHLAIAALLMIIALPPPRKAARIIDVAVVALGALSGPYGLVLAPAAAFLYRVRRDAHRLALAVTLGAGALVEVGYLAATTLSGTGRRHPVELGANLTDFLRIVGRHVVLAPAGHALAIDSATWALGALVLLAAAGVAFALVKAPAELRVILGVSGAFFVLGLIWPYGAKAVGPQWPIMAEGGYERYLLFPAFAWTAVLVWLIARLKLRAVRSAVVFSLGGVTLAAALPLWGDPPFVNLHPDRYAAEVAATARDQTVTVPINPGGWTMTLNGNGNPNPTGGFS